jgi:hypothetical protein
MGIPDSDFDSVLAKFLAAEMRKKVFNNLGAVVNDLPANNLNEGERKELKLRMLDMLEVACGEFFPEMRKRVEKGDRPQFDRP